MKSEPAHAGVVAGREPLPPPIVADVARESYRVRADDIDESRRLSLPGLCRFLQDAASRHARRLGFGIEDLEGHRLIWVLCRLRLVLDAPPPRWHESLVVETWPAALDRVHAFRDFLLYGADGERVGAASTRWMALCVDRRRPVVLPAFVQRVQVPNRPRALEVPDSALAMPPAPSAAGAAAEPVFHVHRCDLDFNRHTNHVRCVEWCLESLPAEAAAGSHVREFDVNYLAESHVGDALRSRTAAVAADGGGRAFAHALVRESDGVAIVRARTVLAEPGTHQGRKDARHEP